MFLVQSLTDFEREGERKRERGLNNLWESGGRQGGRVDYKKNCYTCLILYFVESFILTICLFVQSWNKLLQLVESTY